MRTVDEMIDFCVKKIGSLGMTQREALEKAGCAKSLFILARRRQNYFSIESLNSLAQVLDCSVSDILGIKNEELPEDIERMVSMLKQIPPEHRKMILMNIENYYKVSLEEKS